MSHVTGTELSALASILASLAVLGGLLWTWYRSRTTQKRQTRRDSFDELERLNDLLKAEIARKEAEMEGLRRQQETLKQRNATLLQALSTVTKTPPEVIEWRLQGGPVPPEVRR